MSYTDILFLIFIILTSFATMIIYGDYHHKDVDTSTKIRSMVVDAFFLAIILVMAFVPNLGYLSFIPFVSFTLLHLPVLLGAALGGWKKGLLYGIFFGATSWLQAMQSATGLNFYFMYPHIAILPRALFGLLAGLLFSFIGKVSKNKAKSLYLGLGCAGMTFVHTCLVFLALYAFFPNVIAGLFQSSSPIATGTSLTFTLVILFGMLGEMTLAFLLVPPLYLALSKALPRLFKRK